MELIIHIAICDDNPTDIKEEKAAIAEAMQHKRIPYVITEFNEPKELINTSLSYDMLFLDVEMEGLNGIEVAKAIHDKNKKCLLFFVTNHENYMDAALDEHAFRFWVKPLNKQRLMVSIESAVKRLESYNKIIQIVTMRTKINIEVRKIIYIYAEGKKTYIVTTDEEYMTGESFKSIKEKINSYFFYESHASFYANLNYVTSYSKKDVICEYKDKKYRLHMSRRKYADFNKYFIDWMGEQA